MTVAYKIGDKDTRPWGTWEVITVGENHIVKKICVKPGEILSLQMHHHRDEHWIITVGNAEITLDDKVFEAPANTPIFIKAGQKHRIANKKETPLVFIEIQTGKILDENDIVRFDDRYGRTLIKKQKRILPLPNGRDQNQHQ